MAGVPDRLPRREVEWKKAAIEEMKQWLKEEQKQLQEVRYQEHLAEREEALERPTNRAQPHCHRDPHQGPGPLRARLLGSIASV